MLIMCDLCQLSCRYLVQRLCDEVEVHVTYPELSSHLGSHRSAVIALLYRNKVLHEGVTCECIITTDIFLPQQVIQKLVLGLRRINQQDDENIT